MGTTLLQLKTDVRNRADMANSLFVSDAELITYINGSIAELHDLLIGSEDYYLVEYSVNTIANTATYALPAAFYKLRGVDIRQNSGDWQSLRPFNFNERNSSSDTQSSNGLRYRLTGSNLMLSPAPVGVYEIKIWYTPVATKLAIDADILNDVNQYSEYVIIDAAIKCLNKEESDVSVLLATKADLRKRIENMSASRDAGQPESISDIYAENTDWAPFTD